MNDAQDPNRLFREYMARVDRAVAARDPSGLLSASERCSYSWGLARLGEWDLAEEAARQIDDEDERGQALACLAQSLAAAGFPERAQAVALAVTSDVTFFGAVHEKMVALTACAQSYLCKGLRDEGIRVPDIGLAAFPTFAQAADWEAPDWLVEVADTFYQLRETNRALVALETAAEMVDRIHQDREKIRERIAKKFALLSQEHRARQIAEAITIPAIRERALKYLNSCFSLGGAH